MSSVTHSMHAHTHILYPHPVSFLTFPCTWFQSFIASICSSCPALIVLGGTDSIKQNSKPVEGLKGAVQWNTEHFCRIIPTDTTGAAVWTIGMRRLCLTEKVVQALTIRMFSPPRDCKGVVSDFAWIMCQKSCFTGHMACWWILSCIFLYSVYCMMW